MTIFGRDSLIVSLQSMLVHPGSARGALQKLPELQATERDDWRDAEPGKIPHEIRFGELARLNLIPHTPYYGTADATALYLIVLHEVWKWLGDRDLLREFRDAALHCLGPPRLCRGAKAERFGPDVFSPQDRSHLECCGAVAFP